MVELLRGKGGVEVLHKLRLGLVLRHKHAFAINQRHGLCLLRRLGDVLNPWFDIILLTHFLLHFLLVLNNAGLLLLGQFEIADHGVLLADRVLLDHRP